MDFFLLAFLFNNLPFFSRVANIFVNTHIFAGRAKMLANKKMGKNDHIKMIFFLFKSLILS